MQCPSCQHENRDAAKFCEECATALPLRCTACGAELRPTAKFCDECSAPVTTRSAAPERDPRAYTPKHLAEKILQSKSALEGERKQVTVLFADVKGSMELAEQVDPEEWHRILDRFFQILADGVHRFEGTINQYTGDGIMALFGAPIAHEDHAQRACYAALHLRDGLRRYADELRLSQGLNFSVRMGLNSGEVVVGKIGDDLRMDYTAQGQTVGLAARMEQIAAADRIYVAEPTARLVEGFLQLANLGHSKIEGVANPIAVYELEAAGPTRTRFDVARMRGLSKFVGRDREMGTLEAALDGALEGRGQVVGVVAEAGTGKSRLCYEFAERCRARGIMVREARGVAHGKTIPFLLVFELMRGYFGIAEQDNDETMRDKIAGRVVRLDPELSEELPILLDFLGVPDPGRPSPTLSPEGQQRRLFAIVRRLTQARSEREPALFVFEDLHWIDGASEAFVENQVESSAGTRTLFLVNFRPEYHAEWMQKSYYQQLPLLPLGKEAIQELLGDLLGADPSVGDLSEWIRHRTGGNPFFIEEVVRSLVETGALEGTRGAYRLSHSIDEAAIPPTVQAVLAARIDRLAEREKHVLQTASVIGKTFSESLLARVVDLPETERSEALRALLSAEFLYEEALYPEAEYTFKHPLTQEVAYASQLGDRRRRLHGAVARAIEELHPKQLDERAALLAHHWEEAGEPLEAARWHRNAALWLGTKRIHETVSHWRRVKALLEVVPESQETLALGVEVRGQLIIAAGRLGGSEQDVERLFDEARGQAERSGDRVARALLTTHYAYFKTINGQLPAAGTALEEARALIAEPLDPELNMALLWVSSYFHLACGSVREALPLIERALAYDERDSRLAARIMGLGVRPFFLWAHGFALAGSGRLEEGQRSLEQAAALAREAHPQLLVAVAVARALFGGLFGASAATLAQAREAVQISHETGFAPSLAELALGLALYQNHLIEEALQVLEQGLAAGPERGFYRFSRSGFLLTLARTHLERGELEAARATAEEAAGYSDSWRLFHQEVQLVRAQIEMRTRGAEAGREVEKALADVQRFVDEGGLCCFQPSVHEVRAELFGVRGDNAGRERELREAHRLFTEMGATVQAKRVGRELGL